ncbi:DUF1330 domain-containing protein [Paracoccus wurundjeri]|uniref:DUF1330 domain-containing protein n=1 Tax=Paracoccus onubensis TaxID=1675788 RepID=UPI00351CCEE3
MTAYVVFVRETVTDPQSLDRYRERTSAARDVHPLVPLAFYGTHEVLEGEPVNGVAILSFPSMEAARAWYASPEYQAALPHRLRGSTGIPPNSGLPAGSYRTWPRRRPASLRTLLPRYRPVPVHDRRPPVPFAVPKNNRSRHRLPPSEPDGPQVQLLLSRIARPAQEPRQAIPRYPRLGTG